MIRKVVTAGVFTFGLAIGGTASAEDFTATPLQHGAPRDLPGERLIPGAQLAVDVINGATQPILQPILAPGGDAAAAPAPTVVGRIHHGRHHLAGRHARRHLASKKTHHKTA